MSFSDDFLRQILATFIGEARDHLQAMTQTLLLLEKAGEGDGRAPLLADVFRAAHSLKGAARAVDQRGIEQVAHRLESVFGLLQRGELQGSPALWDLLYQALDGLGALVEQAESGEAATVDVATLAKRLDEAIAGQLPAAPMPEPIPEPPPPLPVAEEPPVLAKSTPAPASDGATRSAEETVRVSTSKLDALLAEAGELQVTQIAMEHHLADFDALRQQVEAWQATARKQRFSQRTARPAPNGGRAGSTESQARRALLAQHEGWLETIGSQMEALGRNLHRDGRRLAQITQAFQEEVRRARMLPLSTLFDIFPRMVRDLARTEGKEVTLQLEGGETEVDRSLLEQLKDPLIHLIRNSVDHGIETPDEREALGKPRGGTITLRAAQQGSRIVLEIEDDGRGIDGERVRRAAVAKGLLTAEAARTLGQQETLWLIFRSGFSTTTQVTELSGRGIGMDVVRENVERLNGLVEVASEPGRGTLLTLMLPLTVATTLCLLLRAGGQQMALPVSNVTRLLRVRPAEVGHAAGREVIRVGEQPVILAHLAQALKLPAAPLPPEGMPAILLGAAERRTAFLVEALLGAQEVVIKPLPRPLPRVRGVAGATILGTGEVIVVLNAAELLRATSQGGGTPLAPAAPPGAPVTVQRILVADDSITTRTLEKNILEVAGFEVHAVADGEEAWRLLQAGNYDLLISDVEMPRMGGIELTHQVRASAAHKALPIILVTSLDSREDRERGAEAGADAYVVKSAFDQETLLETIERLI